MVLFRYFNCAVNKTTNTGHTTNSNYNTNDSIIIILMTYYLLVHGPNLATQIKLSLQNSHCNRPTNVFYCSTWNCVILTGASFGIQDYILENLKMMPLPNNQAILKTST